MSHKVIEIIKETIRANRLVESGSHIVVGLSGGPDSVCLFHVLANLRQELGFKLSAVHLNHRFRPDDAEGDALYSEELCRGLAAGFFGYVRDVAELAGEWGMSDEEAGRKARYEAFSQAALSIAAAEGLDCSQVRIAVAHNRNDQAETVLLRIIRGTGTDGLAAMPYMRHGVGVFAGGVTDVYRGDSAGAANTQAYDADPVRPKAAANVRLGDSNDVSFSIIRPLLDVERSLIEDYCSAFGLSPRRDYTNDKPLYRRNRVRLELIPELVEKYNPGIVDTLCRLASNAAKDRAYFEELTDTIISEQARISEGRLELPLKVFSVLNPALQGRLLVKCFDKIGLHQDVDAVHLNAAADLTARGMSGKSLDFPSGYRLSVEFDKLLFSKYLNDAPAQSGADLQIPGRHTADYTAPCMVIGLDDLRDGFENAVSFEAGAYKVCVYRKVRVPGYLCQEPAGARNDGKNCTLAEDTSFSMGRTDIGKTETQALSFQNVPAPMKIFALDFDLLRENCNVLEIRSRRPQDRISPQGMTGSKKLQDVFVDAKVPRSRRDAIMLIASAKDVLVILAEGRAGRVSRNYPVSVDTKNVLCIRYEI